MASIENYKDIKWSCSSPIRLDSRTKITPKEYLDYSIQDLSLGKDSRCLINAISNAKRALHLQAEIISDALGVKYLHPRGVIPFPKRVEFLKKCGIVGDRILKKLNKIRNSVEHDYYLPSAQEVDDFIDIVELFVAATDRIIACFPYEVEIEYSEKSENSPDVLKILLDPNEGNIYLFSHPGSEIARAQLSEMEMDIDEWQKKHSVSYSSKDSEFFGWVNWLVNAQI